LKKNQLIVNKNLTILIGKAYLIHKRRYSFSLRYETESMDCPDWAFATKPYRL